MMTDRLARSAKDFDGSDQSAGVVGMNLRGGDWVELFEPFVEGLVTDFGDLGFDFFSELPVCRRAWGQPAQQGFQVKGRATDEQDFVASPLDFDNFGVGRLEVAVDAVFFVGVDDVDQMVRHFGLLL